MHFNTIGIIEVLLRILKFVKLLNFLGMKIRDIKGFSKIEYTLVPLIMSAINTSDELSAAAVTRGIENPCQKTSIIDIKMKTFDYTALTISFIFMSLSIYSSSQVI